MFREMKRDSATLSQQAARVTWWRERLLFAALLMALLAALVPALLPSGSPMNRLHGSAFDPTTSTVTLRIRSERDRIIQPAAEPDDDARAPQLPPALPAAAAQVLRPAQSHPLDFAPAASVALPPSRPDGISRPRAPPAAF